MPLKVLLLNPPGRLTYLRDYYCSKVSKANYLNHPVDLLMVSGRLRDRCELKVIDAIADRMSPADCLSRIDVFGPDVVVALSGAVSMDEDRAFLSSLHRPGRRIIVSGDSVLDPGGVWRGLHPEADAALLDFTSEEIVPYVEGGAGPFRDIETRHGAGAMRRERQMSGEFTLPVPRHDLFTSRRYRFPFSRHSDFATVLTDYGCPYHCAFCAMSSLGYRTRSVENVVEELRYLSRRGTREIYFSDQTFGARQDRALELCGRMRDEGFSFGWTCFSRADLLSGGMLDAMAGAGCHTVMMGVESADEALLRKYGKGTTTDRVREAIANCRARSIRTVCTFILGLPDETEASALATIALARELDCDYASFNVAVPRRGTALRDEAVRAGLITADLAAMDQTGLEIAMPTLHLSRAQLQRIRVRAVREFYLRPRYLWRRLRSMTTLHELREHLYEGWELLRGTWR